MHDVSTRACINRRHASALTRSLLAAMLFWAPTPAAQSAATLLDQQTADIGAAGVLPVRPAFDLAMLLVSPGQEGLQLSARLADGTDPIQRNINWRILDKSGSVVASAEAAATEFTLPPGRYAIEANYGSARFVQQLDIGEGQLLQVSFLLNMGAIRVLTSLPGLAVAARPRTLVYANSGADKGRLITISAAPGEILRLLAGTYRLESRVEPGNAVVVTDVTVTPGILSSVEVAHRAGTARLAYAGPGEPEVHWQILTENGEMLTSLEGRSATAVLSPGTYRLEAQVAGETSELSFQVRAGQQSDISIGK